MNKEEIIEDFINKFEFIEFVKTNKISFREALDGVYQAGRDNFLTEQGLGKMRIENNTLTIEIPKGYKTLDTRELSEGDRHWIEVDLMKEEDMCKIRQPHTGFDCKCNKEH